MPADLNFASLICSRLCHDLVGPVGAISNGIELMEMEDDPAMAGDALDLLKHSATNASRRLMFLRLAFGSSGGDEMPLAIDDARRAALDFFEDYRLDLIWPEPAEGAIPKARIRIALNLLMAAASGLVRGGELTVDLTSRTLMITGSHERAGLSEQVVDALSGTTKATESEDARIIECYLAQMLAEAEGLEIDIKQSAGKFIISAA
ncbi:histidine phosphotransferase family protein [Minwuia sp.]|uniref:histidine phosphotransferase family protein n=1 Tax=Minwuia sp. TaxID=2493630 RepID=UPI003A927F18